MLPRGCPKQPSNGLEDTTKATFCSSHAEEGMVHMKSRRCSHDGCSTTLLNDLKGTRNAEFCLKHAEQGMVYAWRERGPPVRAALSS